MLVAASVDTCSQASMTFTDPLLQHSPQSVTFCTWQPAFFGNATTKIPRTSSKLPLDIQKTSSEFSSAKTTEVWHTADSAILQTSGMVQRSETPGFLFYRNCFISKLNTWGSIEYIHINWPCHQPTFAGETRINIHHRKLFHMSWHMSLLLLVLNLILKWATLEFLIQFENFFQSTPLLVVSFFTESEPTFSQVNVSVCWKLKLTSKAKNCFSWKQFPEDKKHIQIILENQFLFSYLYLN